MKPSLNKLSDDMKPVLYVICGLPASGKTTLAKKFELKHKAVFLSEDEWIEKLFGTFYDHDREREIIAELQKNLAQKILNSGASVVLDGGYWSKQERERLREIAKSVKADFELHFMDVNLSILKKRAIMRNKNLSEEFQTKPDDIEKSFYNLLQRPNYEEHIHHFLQTDSTNLTIQTISFGSDLYQKSLDFRYKILREPLRLSWSKKDLDGEESQFHISAICEQKIVGTVVLKPVSKTRIKLRQMAVDESLQGNGIGKKLVLFAENLSKSKGFQEIEMIARMSALDFYKKLGYKTEGDEFEEVTVRSINMIKNFSNSF
jgi:predicted kinase/N-acetylglutamate synthase-like GNAT family acetyltransferase